MRKTDGSTLPPISPRYQFLMWFSGLRGGVAFAIASVGFAKRDFDSVRRSPRAHAPLRPRIRAPAHPPARFCRSAMPPCAFVARRAALP